MNRESIMRNRVVITGLGVVSPNAIGVNEFKKSLKKGRSGIKKYKELKSLNFNCHLAGIPPLEEAQKAYFLEKYRLIKLRSSGILYGCLAGIEAWENAGLEIIPKVASQPDWNSGCIFGAGMTDIGMLNRGIKLVDVGKVKRLGSRLVQQVMPSGISAYLGGLLGLGNQVSSNSSACSTGTEALIIAFDRIKAGKATRMLVGSCESKGPYAWAAFDAMRVLTNRFNNTPEKASRPMSATASGFVPAAGAGALVLEDLDVALKRGAKIHAEVLGGVVNSGGQRGGGTMTATNPSGMYRCIQQALEYCGSLPGEIDAICGHLTSTKGDPVEIRSWSTALNRKGKNFPYINALKSMTGHCLSATGAIECVATVLQIQDGFFHGSLNCEDLHPDIASLIHSEKIPQQLMENTHFNIIAKSNFGFGDVNSCVVFKKWEPEN